MALPPVVPGAAGARPITLGHSTLLGILVSGDPLSRPRWAQGAIHPQATPADRSWATPTPLRIIRTGWLVARRWSLDLGPIPVGAHPVRAPERMDSRFAFPVGRSSRARRGCAPTRWRIEDRCAQRPRAGALPIGRTGAASTRPLPNALPATAPLDNVGPQRSAPLVWLCAQHCQERHPAEGASAAGRVRTVFGSNPYCFLRTFDVTTATLEIRR